jgi:phytoene/squalene synthetase
MKYEYARASSYFEKAAGSLPDQDRPSMFAAEIMGAIYRELLDQIPVVQFDVLRNRLTVSKSRRLRIALSIWLKSKFKK